MEGTFHEDRNSSYHLDELRVDWVDAAKGLCILLVVMMHATLGTEQAMGGEGFLHSIVAFAKPFRMPDFYMISGLFLSRVIDRDWRTYADRRVVHFAYFYVIWLLMQSALKYNQIGDGTGFGFAQQLLWSLIEPYGTLWFIYMLAVFSVTAKLIKSFPPILLIAGAASLQILHIQTGSLIIDEFCERFVFFMGGYLFAGSVFRIAAWSSKNIGLASIGLSVWAVANGVLAISAARLNGYTTLASLPVVSLVLGGAGAIAVVTAASLLTSAYLAAPLRYLGQRSIVIYLAFFLPMALARTLLVKSAMISDIGLVSFIVTAIAVAVPLGLERLVRRTPARFLFQRPLSFRLRANNAGTVGRSDQKFIAGPAESNGRQDHIHSVNVPHSVLVAK
jgi:uncharacterized membrane protein YcfT